MVFSSAELKGQVSYYDHILLVVRQSVSLSVRPSVCLSVNFSHFDTRATGPNLNKIGIKHPIVRGILNFKKGKHT